MVRHTLATLGPKVQATRMVTEYVRRLYAPAAAAGRALTAASTDAEEFGPARDLAAWKARVREQWPHVRVDHVESGGVGDAPQVGDALQVRAYVSLAGLSPDDVAVQVLHGRVSESDDLTAFGVADLAHLESYEAGRHAFGGHVTLAASGPFGYTVRIVPRHPALASVAELGLVVNAG
jgi:starch phosphorylase